MPHDVSSQATPSNADDSISLALHCALHRFSNCAALVSLAPSINPPGGWIAALLLLDPQLDANYIAVKVDLYTWPRAETAVQVTVQADMPSA